jgi:DNA-binding GntR family transcriptional regulator
VEVDRSSPVAPYVQVANQLRDAILAGVYEPGSRLPSVEAIVQEAGIAKLTARKVLKRLREQGYAQVSMGMGTYVAPRENWPERKDWPKG